MRNQGGPECNSGKNQQLLTDLYVFTPDLGTFVPSVPTVVLGNASDNREN